MATRPFPNVTAAIGRRYDFLNFFNGRVAVRELEVGFPPVVQSAPGPIFSQLAREHPWDIGEQGFSTYLMAYDLGKPQLALPVFPSRFFPHLGAWVGNQSGIRTPQDLVGRRVGCNSFGANYGVWLRGVLAHQYDVPVERITWVTTGEEHLPEYQPPRRMGIERVAGSGVPQLLARGAVDAASLPAGGVGVDQDRARRLFEDPYAECRAFGRQFGFVPANTVITVSREAVQRVPEMPRLMFEAFAEAMGQYEADIAAGKEDEHMGLSLRQLDAAAGLKLPPYGFKANRDCIQAMITFCYEQGIIRKWVTPEDLFLLADG